MYLASFQLKYTNWSCFWTISKNSDIFIRNFVLCPDENSGKYPRGNHPRSSQTCSDNLFGESRCCPAAPSWLKDIEPGEAWLLHQQVTLNVAFSLIVFFKSEHHLHSKIKHWHLNCFDFSRKDCNRWNDFKQSLQLKGWIYNWLAVYFKYRRRVWECHISAPVDFNCDFLHEILSKREVKALVRWCDTEISIHLLAEHYPKIRYICRTKNHGWVLEILRACFFVDSTNKLGME